MTVDELKEKVAALLKDERTSPTPYDEALRKLRELASAIEASLKPDVKVVLEPGHVVIRVRIVQSASPWLCGLRNLQRRRSGCAKGSVQSDPFVGHAYVLGHAHRGDVLRRLRMM